MRVTAAIALLAAAVQTYPPPFPRQGIVKILENDYGVAWDAHFPKDVRTDMHRHTMDTVAYFVTPGQVIATLTDGVPRTNEPFPGDRLLFNPKGVTHIEQWISDGTKAIALELKDGAPLIGERVDAPADPVAVAPDIYKVRLENDRVRVLEATDRPGASSRLHAHPGRLVMQLGECRGASTPSSATATTAGPRVWWASSEAHEHRTSRLSADCRSLEIEVKRAW